MTEEFNNFNNFIYDDFDDEIDYDYLNTKSKDEINFRNEYNPDTVEIHISNYPNSQKIIELMDTYHSLKKITCPNSIYNRIPLKYIKALNNLEILVEVKYKRRGRKKKYSLNQINQIIDLFNEGKRFEEISAILNMPISNIKYIKGKYHDKINVKHYKRKYDDKCRVKIKFMKKKGLKHKEISKKLNIPLRTIYYILNKK